jgi:hypothetical protein
VYRLLQAVIHPLAPRLDEVEGPGRFRWSRRPAQTTNVGRLSTTAELRGRRGYRGDSNPALREHDLISRLRSPSCLSRRGRDLQFL